MKTAAIILAAGASSRFGSDKLCYPLTLYGVKAPLIVHTLRAWLAVFEQVFLVVKPQAEVLQSLIDEQMDTSESGRIVWVHSLQAAQGMSASIVAGVTATSEANGWLIGLADMPAVPTDVIAKIRQAIAQGALLAAPFCGERRGHPVGFAQSYGSELLQLQGDIGAKALLTRDAANMHRIEVDALAGEQPGIFFDVDHVSDIENLGINSSSIFATIYE